jgi:polysaccharide deacetylase family protein (PEP-CTERM system associated)
MTCDVEDYFQVSAFENIISRDAWQTMECRIGQNVDRILERFDEAGVSGTFFTLGWVARHYPSVVRRVADAGHEIASHGMQHVRVYDQTADQFLEDIVTTKKLLEDVSGQEVKGYRAASWSIDKRTPWAHEKMAEAGYRYSSSIYPVSHDHYGVPDAPVHPFFIQGSELLEIPASCSSYSGRNVPAAGGGFFRLFPFSVSRSLMRRVREKSGIPAIFYFHPWELDPAQPRVEGIPAKTRFRHYLNLGRFEDRLVRLLREFEWSRMDRIYLTDD